MMNSRKYIDYLFKNLFFISMLISILFLLLIGFYLFYKSLNVFQNIPIKEFLFSSNWNPSAKEKAFGIFPMILTSLYVTIGAILISTPLSIICAIYLNEFADKKLKIFSNYIISLLVAIPSVVYGLTASVVFFNLGLGFSILSAILILSFMLMPTIISISKDALKMVAEDLKQGSASLGANKIQIISTIIIPSAKNGIFAAVLLALGRAFGETMAVKMVIGNIQTSPDFSYKTFFGLLSPARTLTTNIISDIEYAQDDLHISALFATGLVLFIITALTNYIAHKIFFRNR